MTTTPDGKPTEITAADWNLVAEDVKAGHCIVKHPHKKDFKIRDIEILENDNDVCLLHFEPIEWKVSGFSNYYPDKQKLQITWLDSTASSGTDAETAHEVNNLIGSKDLPLHWIESHREHTTWLNSVDKLKNDVLDLADLAEALQADNDSLRQQLAEAEGRQRELREGIGTYREAQNP